jgi:hypothetical protein
VHYNCLLTKCDAFYPLVLVIIIYEYNHVDLHWHVTGNEDLAYMIAVKIRHELPWLFHHRQRFLELHVL